MDRGAWRATVNGVAKSQDITESTEQAHVTSAQPHQPLTLLQSLE